MNTVHLCGRLVRDPEVRYSQGEKPTAIARYTIAVDRKYQGEGNQTADFIQVVAFGKNGEFVEKYLHKGMKILVTGHIQTGSYTDKNGEKKYTYDVIAEEHEFVEKKAQNEEPKPQTDKDGFMNVPESDMEDLPFAKTPERKK